ncbi:EAL domain-containing protein [Acidovorax sp. LjRoot66]|uniref:EAL domain-containing protein n=1 Tax=Acidovorax sp. LjRoot66 TaxID=3342334 RepID=UPI003ECC7395
MAKLLKLRRRFERMVLAGFIAATIVVAALASVTWTLAQDARDAAHLVSHTHQVVNAISQAKSDTLQIELSTQNYRISGDTNALADRNRKMDDRENAMRLLLQLIADDPAQVERWTKLRAVLDQRITIAKQVEVLRTTQGGDAATAFATRAPLRETRERTHALFDAMGEQARAVLQVRTADQLRTQGFLAASGLVAALLLAALLAGTYGLIRRQLMDSESNQRALMRSEAKLSTTLRSLGDAVLECDVQGRVTGLNPVAEHLTGWTLCDALGQHADAVFKLIRQDGQFLDRAPVARVLATNESYEEMDGVALVRRSGSACPIGATAAPIRDETGQLQGVVLVFRDISAEQEARQFIRDQNALLEKHVRERTLQLLDTQEHLSSVMSSVPAMIAYVDAQQRYVYVNEQYRARFAPDGGDITGHSVSEVLGEDRYAIASPIIDQVMSGAPQSYDWQPFPGVWQAISYVPKRDTLDGIVGYYVLGSDITGRKLSEERIHSLNAELGQRLGDLERVTRAWKTLSAGNSAMLRATDEQQLLETMCKAIVDAGGYPIAMVWYRVEDAARSMRPMAESGFAPGIAVMRTLNVTWSDGEFGRGAIATCLRTGMTQVVGDMQTNPNYQHVRSILMGNASCIACPLVVGGVTIGTMAIFAKEPDTFGPDETRLLTESAEDLAFGIASLRANAQHARAEQEMRRLTRFDVLTGLPNEAQFTEIITHAIEAARAAPGGQSFALLQVNVERLRDINEALGFAHGDQLLQEFGERLRSASPDANCVARLRGDEFALLLSAGDERAAVGMVSRIQALLHQPFAIADIFLDVSARTGIALFPAHGSAADDLLRHLDFAVHQAKSRELQFCIYDPQTIENRPERLTMAGELRRAIERGDLRLYLQPKIDFTSGRLLGSEALVRWQHADRGLMPPAQFIELAEQTGLIKNLTEWVIEAAMRVCREAQGRGDALPIAVNLSARNLRDEGLLGRVQLLHQSWGVDRGLLEFEITESVVMEDPDAALRILHGLRAQGVSLYIDDFGTGYSSLSYLLKLPVEYIKIDQSFVRDMSTNNDSAVIVKSTIDLAHALGRKVVAEGIETQRDWDRLAELGCDVAQGYFIARPMPAADFPAWALAFEERREVAGADALGLY